MRKPGQRARLWLINLWPYIVSVLHVVFAAAVTMHVLLAHQDVRSSIGWIGLAWLSPFLGSAVYVAFGINRVQRRGSRLNMEHRLGDNGGARDAAELLDADVPENMLTLARAVDAIAELPLTKGNHAIGYQNGDEAYPAMLEAINGAQSSIALSSYIFKDDEGGAPFVDALIEAHERGVHVRVLADGIGSGYILAPAIRRLQAAGVPAALFLHELAPWRMSFINLRNHKKVLVVDGHVGFTGGMNISAKNLTRGAADGPEVRDLQVRLEGPIVEHLMLTFATDWEFTTGETLVGAHWWPELGACGGIAMRGISSGPDESVLRVETTILTAIEQARERIRILTPYFLPEAHVLGALERAALRGVRIEIVVPANNNHWYFNWAMRAHISTLPLSIIDFRLSSGPFDHSKFMSIDGIWGAFGSANWDARSMRLNFEILVECYGRQVGHVIDRVIDQKQDGAQRVTSLMLARRPLPTKLGDAALRLLLPYM